MNKTQTAIREIAKRYRFESPWVIPLQTSDGRPLGQPYVPRINRWGYPVISVRMRKLDISIALQVHQLVAYQQYGEAIFAPRVMCRHINNDKTDFRPENLVLGNALDNHQDNPAHIQQALIERAVDNAKRLRRFSDNEVRTIRVSIADGESRRSIACRMGCTTNTIVYIDKGKTYRDVI